MTNGGDAGRTRGEARAIHALALAALCAGLAAAPSAPAAALSKSDAAEDGALGGGGTLRIAAQPRRLVLGRDLVAELRIAAPAGVDALAVTANAGAVEAVSRTPEGGFTARYVAPLERVPRIVIVAAHGRTAAGDLVDGWIAIPLYGHGRARIVATPGTEIALRIGDRSFGPVRADEQGRAIVPVVVPPGVREGHHGFRPVDLGVPETSLVHAVADRHEIPAAGPSEVRFRAYVVAPHGAARRGDVPHLEASRGTWAITAREPGAFEGVWRLPPGPPGEARLVVSLPGASASRSVLHVHAIGPSAATAVAARGGAPAAPAAGTGPEPSSGVALLASGAIVAARGHAGASFAIAAERATPRLDPRLRLRLEGRLAGWPEPGPDPAVAAVLAGASAHRALSPRIDAWAAAGLGVAASWARGGDASPALRPAAAVSFGIGRRMAWGTPFLEVGALGAGALTPGGGAAAAVTLGLGVRFDLAHGASSGAGGR